MKSKIHYFCTVLFTVMFLSGFTQRQTPQQYIEKWKAVAIKEMKEHKIPASITLAQGILESGSGNSNLAILANNHFGIKCHSSWTGETYYQDDDAKDECFRKYNNAKESFKDHSIFLQKTRYKPLFELKITDYKKWAKGLKKAGYATNPKYPKLLIGIIERYNLTQYDIESDVIVTTRIEEKDSIKKEEEIIQEEISISLIRTNFSSANRVPFILAKKGDTFEKLEKDLNIRKWQILKYNDIEDNHILFLKSFFKKVSLSPEKSSSKIDS